MSGNVLCIGDIILDSYSHGDVKRISPEAPIPVLKINNNKYEVLGGCGNVAKNICGAGSKCHIISVCGDDEESIVLKKLLKDSKKLTFNLFTDQSRSTTKKTRFVNNKNYLDFIKRQNKLIIYEENTSLKNLIENSLAVISYPFTTIGYLAGKMGKNSVYYDPTSSISDSHNSLYGLKLLKTRDQLNNYFESNIIC